MNPFADPAVEKRLLIEALYAPVASEPLRMNALWHKIKNALGRLFRR